MDAVAACLEFSPSAVEVMDQLILELARDNLSLKDNMAAVLGRPGEIDPPIMALKPGVDYGESNLELVREARPRLLPRYQSLADADLLVMGAYSHSRLREMVFGGVTKRVLNDAALPVLMVH